jgi:hypothetical protein
LPDAALPAQELLVQGFCRRLSQNDIVVWFPRHRSFMAAQQRPDKMGMAADRTDDKIVGGGFDANSRPPGFDGRKYPCPRGKRFVACGTSFSGISRSIECRSGC